MLSSFFKKNNNNNNNNSNSSSKLLYCKLTAKQKDKYDYAIKKLVDFAEEFKNFNDLIDRLNNSIVFKFKNNGVHSATVHKSGKLLINSRYIKIILLAYLENVIQVDKYIIDMLKKDTKLINKVFKKSTLVYNNKNFYFSELDNKLQKGYLINTINTHLRYWK